ncbi:hypothetical protein pEaSNUABM5_00306 [Erwinia phage pEa_SNUABM_5]|uniref:Uncharacterized protein n=1 Tax=Erwinia phage pEa_SNUABM_5 TaxID=2797313 RepID=A0A7T8EPR9_9CAUD|nr:hypothetical protein MPK73_gp306 [Erwinia phage pEa_SNUABM_5]QQO90448.1 hypothetical protein pEaSNUABM5_00306 [Erwinia phage pEa_SNUABM_5]
MKKETKKALLAVGAGAATACAVVGAVVFLGRSDSTHNASVITHGLKELGKLVGGDSMLAGVGVVATVPVVAATAGYGAGHFVFDEDTINKAAGTPPPAATNPDPEPRFSEYNDMTAFVDALRKWEARQPDAEEDIVAQYDRWEEAQRARRASQPVHPMYKGKVVSLDEARRINVLDFIDEDDLDEAI